MRVRKHLAPRRPNDVFCFLLIVIALPAVFMFEVVVVLPEMHQSGTKVFWFTYIFALFLLHNIVGNFVVCIIVDTSVNFNELKPSPAAETIKDWHHCEKCQKYAPPRAWHCAICDSCILKRDHHCVFTGCCIGHHNHRYFILFLLYLAIGSVYAFVYNSIYIWVIKSHVYTNWLTPLKIICPLLLISLDNTIQNMYLVAYSLNFIAVLYSVVLFIYHIPIVLKGGTSFESDNKCFKYNIGWRGNLQRVFGKRMRFILLSPFIASDLPNDGLVWPELQSIAQLVEEKPKNN